MPASLTSRGKLKPRKKKVKQGAGRGATGVRGGGARGTTAETAKKSKIKRRKISQGT